MSGVDRAMPLAADLDGVYRGVTLELDETHTAALASGQSGQITVDAVRFGGEPDYVVLEGRWCGPDGEEKFARVEVRRERLGTARRVLT
jgi:hypothetical protein